MCVYKVCLSPREPYNVYTKTRVSASQPASHLTCVVLMMMMMSFFFSQLTLFTPLIFVGHLYNDVPYISLCTYTFNHTAIQSKDPHEQGNNVIFSRSLKTERGKKLSQKGNLLCIYTYLLHIICV